MLKITQQNFSQALADSISFIGVENLAALARCISGGGTVYLFRSREEIKASELSPAEQEEVQKVFLDDEGWGGFFRPPTNPAVLLFNRQAPRGGGHRGSSGNWSH